MNFAIHRNGFRAAPRRSRGGVIVGIFIGLVLGLAIAAAVAYYLGRSGSGLSTPLSGAGPAKDALRAGKGEAAPDKPRFDFYKILPGGEEPKIATDRAAKPATVERLPDAAAPETIAKAAIAIKPSDRFWLQAGAFTSVSDAESLKARLALAGWEAAVQPAAMPDKSVRYRVRLGPYDNTDELNRIKSDLGKSGFDASVIRNQ